jgi:hypothetical protein
MREEYGALVRRAAAALGVSVALHLAVVALGGSLFLGALLAGSEDSAPLIVDVVEADARPVTPPAAARTIRVVGRPPAPVALPPIIPVATDEAVAPPAPGPSTDAPGVALDTGGTATDLETAASSAAPSILDPVADASQVAHAVPLETQDPGSGAGHEETASVLGPAPPVADAAEPAAIPDPRVNLARLDEVTRNPSVAARAAGQPFVGRRDVFEFLLDHPDFATHVTRALRLARYRMWRTDDGLFVDDGWGATGQVFVVQATSGQRVLYARGAFQSKLLPAIHGEAVVTIDYDVKPAGDGRDLLFAAISSQLKIEGVFGDLVATLARSMAIEKAEKESRRLVRVFARVLQAVDETPAALYASLRERPDVPQFELEQFRALLKLP